MKFTKKNSHFLQKFEPHCRLTFRLNLKIFNDEVLYFIGILLIGLFQNDRIVISYERIFLTVGWFLSNLVTLFSSRHN